MERASKSSRKVPNSERNVDRLSALPDGVICHILSFLPTKRSVQTSILTKRWRFLWAHVPVLAFEFDYANSKRASFPGIINTVMLRHKVQSLKTFLLTCFMDAAADDGPFGCFEHETCIATVVERNIQNLYLELRVEVPRCLLTCKTLVKLTLRYGVSIPPTAPISLLNLKELRLWDLECEVDFTRLLSGCPVLEELDIQGTKCRNPRGCSISSSTLKRLTIICLLDSSMFDNPDYLVKINTPALTSLTVHDHLSKHISISLSTFVVEADICINSLCEPDDFNRRCVLKFLDSIRNVKYLRISGFHDKIFDGPMPGSIAKFDNLTELTLCANWSILLKFLESADHLQVLTIFEVSNHWKNPVEKQCACLLHSLRTVRIDYFSCTEQASNMVRYILRNAQVMERMEIYCTRLDVEKKYDAIRKISVFPRESKKCELHFS